MFKPRATISVLVVGDIILDQYIHGDTHRISPEAPVPVVRIDMTEERPGGAANVAMNVAALGASARLLGVTGADAAANRLHDLLAAAAVDCHFIRQEQFPTITKQRILSRHQQLLRLDYENPAQKPGLDELRVTYEKQLGSADIVILSDYAKGSLGQCRQLIELAKRHKVPVLVDPKSGDFSLYHGASVITPNLKEFEAIVGRCHSDGELVEKGRRLCVKHNLAALLVTRGEQGMTLIPAADQSLHLGAETHEVYDVTGAGDTVIATLATALACDYPLSRAVTFANSAAGLVVGKLGAASVGISELNASIPGRDSRSGVMTADEALALTREWRRQGERIAMTNGCFDLLHSGHVQYLDAAKRLGDKLVVAVNSDASVRLLKGETRPVNRLRDRMNVIAALASVDVVVAFDEETPTSLISRLCPDVLAKGGDYTEDQVAGAAEVKQAGGEVIILPFHAGYSTTEILESVNQQGKVHS